MARPKKAAPEQAQEKAAPEQAQEKAAPEQAADGLVRMKKGDEFIDVHETCVKAHKDAGWKVVE